MIRNLSCLPLTVMTILISCSGLLFAADITELTPTIAITTTLPPPVKHNTPDRTKPRDAEAKALDKVAAAYQAKAVNVAIIGMALDSTK